MASESFLQLRVESIAAFASCRAGEMSGALMLVVRGACSIKKCQKVAAARSSKCRFVAFLICLFSCSLEDLPPQLDEQSVKVNQVNMT